uniref:Uncharacterized protein n=1 Tax=Setaria italica TaxID=4555 RepID=K3XNH4_SETIT
MRRPTRIAPRGHAPGISMCALGFSSRHLSVCHVATPPYARSICRWTRLPSGMRIRPAVAAIAHGRLRFGQSKNTSAHAYASTRWPIPIGRRLINLATILIKTID